MIRLAIVTVSDKSSAGQREDAGGPAIRETLGSSGVEYSEVEYQANDAQAEDDGGDGLPVHGMDSRVRASQSRDSSPVMRASSTRAEISA